MPERTASDAELEALIQLLDDPDEMVQDAVRKRLRELGRSAIPELRKASGRASGESKVRLDDAIHRLHFLQVESAWRQIMQVPQPDLESGAFVLALYLHPELNIPRYQGILDSFAEEARLCLRDAVGIERAYRLAEFISDDLGFTGNQRDYYNPDNSCLDWVIDNRTGIPVSLGVIYLILAARLRIPSFGVNMPAHFLVKYEDDGAEVFIDLFHKRMLSRSDCIRLLYHMEIEPRPKYLEATTERQILTRMLRNLTAIASETVRYAPWLT